MIKVLKGRERRVLEQRLKAQYSAKIPENLEVVLQSKKEFRLTTREALQVDIESLNPQGIGLKIAKETKHGIMLSIEGAQLLKPEAKIINLSLDQAYSWVRGRNLDIKAPEGYVILKYDGYYLGCGLSRGEHIKNLYPKHRRIV